MTIKEEPASKCVGELFGLFHAHGKVVVGKDFNLNAILFTDSIKSGMARFFVARLDDGTPVGYAYANVYRSPMESNKTMADVQAIYVQPEYRGRTSVKLIAAMEDGLKKVGVSYIVTHVPAYDMKQMRMFLKSKIGYYAYEYALRKEL